MWQMIARDITAPYSAAEAWLYDAIVGPASLALFERLGAARIDELPRGARLLDVGCGGGHNLLALAARRPDLELTGLDLSPGQVSRATHRARRAGATVRFVEGSALEIPFEHGEFDAVMSAASIKHWPNQARGLAECARVLRGDGHLLVAEADRGCRLDDARAFVALTRVPRAFRPAALAGFRTWVAGQGIDLDDARELAAALPLRDVSVYRARGVPIVMIDGRRG